VKEQVVFRNVLSGDTGGTSAGIDGRGNKGLRVTYSIDFVMNHFHGQRILNA
jgi:hypothetical protein